MIKRPVKVQRAENKTLSNEQYQVEANKQFNTIYDYLDGQETTTDVAKLITFNETPANYHIKARNGVVYMDYNGQAKTHTQGEVLFVIPEGYRPEGSIFTPSIQGTTYARVWINGETGEVQISSISNTTNADRINFTISYLIN